MATFPVIFSGGPCSGQTKRLTDDVVRAGAVSCGGVNYVIQSAGGPNLYRAVPAKDLEPVTPPATTGNHKQFDTAWARLMRTLAFTVPANDKRIGAATQRIRKAVR